MANEETAREAYEAAAASAKAQPGAEGFPEQASPEAQGESAQTEDAFGGDAGAPDDVGALLAEAERQRDEYLDALRRERAEFDNFRKRTTKERMDALDRGAEQVVASLLGTLDSFGLALAAAEGEETAEDPLAKGVRMVHTEFLGVLHAAGLEEVPGVGADFDPTVHEAVAQVDAAEAGLEPSGDEPVVAEVLRPGYRFKGRVLRPAAVKVAR